MVARLTQRQQEYLKFIRNFTAENQFAPLLKEIAQNFNVESSTANKALKTLQEKGHLYFGRSETLGYYIRLPEWHTSGQRMVEVSNIGFVNQYGMLYEFPTLMGHFPTLRMYPRKGKPFVLRLTADIPHTNLLGGDQLFCERDLTPKQDDICIALIGPGKYFLVQILEIFPKDDKVDETHYTWNPIAYYEDTHDYFMEFAQKQGWILETIPESLIYAAVTWMQRDLVY